ncbi:MAG: glutamate--tRNA ligase [Thermoguttaceae bacterium]
MIRTRFAPSPTGYLHIGGVRTALFCWLFARQQGGEFILRIDDTDQQRNVEEALAPILDGLEWLGINWDEGPRVGGPHAPYYQSQRGEKYQAAVDTLIANGAAYRDFGTTEEIQAERDAAMSEKRTFTYSRRWMATSDADAERFRAEGRSGVVRLKMPREGTLTIPDLVRGNVEFQWSDEQDHVIQRADGSFIYHLASVVDDADFEITHVIRAEEHLSNTPRQIFMLTALGYKMPQYAHLPFVAEPGSKTKLSKRKLEKYLKNKDFAKLVEHGLSIVKRMGHEVTSESFNPVMTAFYEELGYLPEAIVNYLALLGWSLDDKTEFFTRDELTKLFTLDRVTKGAASFDPAKLFAFQEKYFVALAVDEKIARCEPFLSAAKITPNAKRLRDVIVAAGDRIKVAGDILDWTDFFTSDADIVYDEAAFKKRIVEPTEAKPLLAEFANVLEQQTDFTAAALEQTLQRFVESKSIKVNQIIHALRVAVTGKPNGLGMFETLEILGRNAVCARINRALTL